MVEWHIRNVWKLIQWMKIFEILFGIIADFFFYFSLATSKKKEDRSYRITAFYSLMTHCLRSLQITIEYSSIGFCIKKSTSSGIIIKRHFANLKLWVNWNFDCISSGFQFTDVDPLTINIKSIYVRTVHGNSFKWTTKEKKTIVLVIVYGIKGN